MINKKFSAATTLACHAFRVFVSLEVLQKFGVVRDRIARKTRIAIREPVRTVCFVKPGKFSCEVSSGALAMGDEEGRVVVGGCSE